MSSFIYFTIVYMANYSLARVQDAREKLMMKTNKVLVLVEFAF